MPVGILTDQITRTCWLSFRNDGTDGRQRSPHTHILERHDFGRSEIQNLGSARDDH